MPRKYKIILVIVCFLVVALMIGYHLILRNYLLGRDLYNYGNSMAIQCDRIVSSIDYLEKEYAALEDSDEEVHTHSFEEAIKTVWSYFGTKDLPFLDDVREQYIDILMEVFHQLPNDGGIRKMFTEETDIDIYGLRDQLKIVVNTFVDFAERYNEMSEWERYFTSWKRVREELTETVRIPEN